MDFNRRISLCFDAAAALPSKKREAMEVYAEVRAAAEDRAAKNGKEVNEEAVQRETLQKLGYRWNQQTHLAIVSKNKRGDHLMHLQVAADRGASDRDGGRERVLSAAMGVMDGESGMIGAGGRWGNIRAHQQSYTAKWQVMLDDITRAMYGRIGRSFLAGRFMRGKNRAAELQVADALVKENGDGLQGDLSVAYQKVQGLKEDTRQTANSIIGGGPEYFRYRKGWLPQDANPHELARYGEDAFVEFMQSRVRSPFADGTKKETDASLRDQYRRLVERDEGAVGGKVIPDESRSRHFYFRDGNAYLEYLERYGVGKNLGEAMAYHIDRRARQSAVLQVFGNDVDEGIEALTQKLEELGVTANGVLAFQRTAKQVLGRLDALTINQRPTRTGVVLNTAASFLNMAALGKSVFSVALSPARALAQNVGGAQMGLRGIWAIPKGVKTVFDGMVADGTSRMLLRDMGVLQMSHMNRIGEGMPQFLDSGDRFGSREGVERIAAGFMNWARFGNLTAQGYFWMSDLTRGLGAINFNHGVSSHMGKTWSNLTPLVQRHYEALGLSEGVWNDAFQTFRHKKRGEYLQFGDLPNELTANIFRGAANQIANRMSGAPSARVTSLVNRGDRQSVARAASKAAFGLKIDPTVGAINQYQMLRDAWQLGGRQEKLWAFGGGAFGFAGANLMMAHAFYQAKHYLTDGEFDEEADLSSYEYMARLFSYYGFELFGEIFVKDYRSNNAIVEGAPAWNFLIGLTTAADELIKSEDDPLDAIMKNTTSGAAWRNALAEFTETAAPLPLGLDSRLADAISAEK